MCITMIKLSLYEDKHDFKNTELLISCLHDYDSLNFIKEHTDICVLYACIQQCILGNAPTPCCHFLHLFFPC